MLSLNLLYCIHQLILLNSVDNFSCNVLIFSSFINKVISSAYIVQSSSELTLIMSFIYIKKVSVPK